MESNIAGFRPKQTGPATERKGSVRRAREMLQAGIRREVPTPESNNGHLGAPDIHSDSAHLTHWPLPDSPILQGELVPQIRPLVPNGPPPQRPPLPSNVPSPLVYSENAPSEYAPSLQIRRPVPSFSHLLPYQVPPTAGFDGVQSPTGSADLTRISIATEDLFRQSAASSVGPIPEFPAIPAEKLPIQNHTERNAHLAPPPAARHTRGAHKSLVSPIPEELSDSPTLLVGSYASSKIIPSSWGSAPSGSEILGPYADGQFDDEQGSKRTAQEDNSTLVRQASVGKRGKPSLRMIQKSRPDSPDPPPEARAMFIRPPLASGSVSAAAAKEAGISQNQGPQSNKPGPRDALSISSSADSYEWDLEKAPILLDVGQPNTGVNYVDHSNRALEKETGVFPKAAPTMSAKRREGRRPPRLDMDAVRDAEARGSLTSLPDLIRRATRLASNLERGRTASRADLFEGSKDFRFGQRVRNSGSISEILNSFPNPAGPVTPDGRSSWPIFFKRPTQRSIPSIEAEAEAEGPQNPKRQRRCCGLPVWLFALVSVIIVIIILLAVLLPVFLVVVPRQNASSGSTCAKTTPCENGGVSVSSGNICACVCANGYTGRQCTIAGDVSCVTTEIDSQNVTMGSDLPRLFEGSEKNFSIALDSTTILAMFSHINVSCTTENALVSFAGLETSSKLRRSLDEPSGPNQWMQTARQSPSSTTVELPMQTIAARASVATSNGILFDNSSPTESIAIATKTRPTSTASATHPTSTPQATPSSSPISSKVLDFSRIAVLYIFGQTGSLSAGVESEQVIQNYLTGLSPTSSRNYSMDISSSGVTSKFTLDFDNFTITTANGTVIGGKFINSPE